MNIEDFDIAIKTSHTVVHECLIRRKTEENYSGIIVQGPQPPPPQWVLTQFITNSKAFFIDVLAIPVETVVVVPETPLPTSGSTEALTTPETVVSSSQHES